ncbi:MAG: hypothetical protein J2P28_24640 [Actinobacteria bacterium]|nr:hypothetical protein [Actinomycetota bacterium]MBO0838682.1 hypothetical protein [Actinomycetota bacterium]
MSAIKPPSWLVPWSLLAGLLLTLAFLGSMDWKQIPDCGQRSTAPYTLYSLPGGCATITEGYPVRYLSTTPTLEENPGGSWRTASLASNPIINKLGLVEDWFIWSIATFVILYGLVAMDRRSQLAHPRQLPNSGDSQEDSVRNGRRSSP